MKILLILILTVLPCISENIVKLERDDNGITTARVYYTDDKEVARMTLKDDEIVKATGNIPDGVIKGYTDDGKILESEVTYKKGKKEGTAKQYFSDSGILWFEVVYKNDKLDGEQKVYNANGGLRYTAKFKDGKLISPSIEEYNKVAGWEKLLLMDNKDADKTKDPNPPTQIK